MVYYTALPLIMQSEQSSLQGCSNQSEANGRNNVAINYHQVPQTSQSINSNEQQNNLLSSNNLNENQIKFNNFQTTISNSNLNNNNNNNNSNCSNNDSKKTQQKPQFKCEQCQMNFGSKSAHTSHMKSHAKQYQNQNTFYTLGNIPASSSSSNIISNANTINITTATTVVAEPYQCDVCKKTFAVPARLVRHYRTHTGERPFACEFCHKTFSVKENLQVHRRIHTKERPYKCDVCGRAFEHSGKLHRHMRIHTGERPHKCSVCGKTFIQSGQLVIHMRTHTGEKPYKCPVEGCGKGFTCSKQLKVHSRTHTGEKPYHCDICFRDFGYNHVLKLHRVQHYGSKCYKCTICEETFKSKKEMEAHIKGHANDIPDDDDDDQTENLLNTETNSRNISSIKHEDSSVSSSSPTTQNILTVTPKDSISDGNSDGDDGSYYNMYSRFTDHTANSYNNSSKGVDPALLAAASIAAAISLDEPSQKRFNSMSPISSSPNSNNPSYLNVQSTMQPPTQLSSTKSTSANFLYDSLPVVRPNYFASSNQTAEFKPSEASANLVRRVEEAIAIAEPLLTPPRSSPESPDRSSSPESDSIVMADRDILSLPPRKRKLYLKDNQKTEQSSPTIRMNSVIQFAKAS